MNKLTDAPIPFLDLVTPHLEIEEELVSVFRSVVKTAGFIGGPLLENFEKDFADFCGTQHCVGVASGTDALRFALMAAGVGPGQIVVTVPNTFIATTEAISQAGGVPDFVDIDESTYNVDPMKLREYIDTKCFVDRASGRPVHKEKNLVVSAVVPVHLYGQPADMDPILEMAEKYNLVVVEDACQAHGAEYFSKRGNSWKKAGSMGAAAAFSFYPGKNLGACGEAGAVTTDDPAIAARIRIIRDHGQPKKYYHDLEGYNGRLDAIQAGILQVKLKHLSSWNEKRRQCAAFYNEQLGKAPGVITPFAHPGTRPVYHLYVIRIENRDALQKYLADNGVATGLHYPVPLHLQNCYRTMNFTAGTFPATEMTAARTLSLPMGPTLDKSQVERVSRLICRFMAAN